jgi:5-methylcytosine-specific restriction endonuclease McrA
VARDKKADPDKLDSIVANAHRERDKREHDYREQALKLYPWVCGRCGREFTRETLHELTVHHRDHNHDNNPSDGSNWELLCVYCHDNEHARHIDNAGQALSAPRCDGEAHATHQPFAELKSLLKNKDT